MLGRGTGLSRPFQAQQKPLSMLVNIANTGMSQLNTVSSVYLVLSVRSLRALARFVLSVNYDQTSTDHGA